MYSKDYAILIYIHQRRKMLLIKMESLKKKKIAPSVIHTYKVEFHENISHVHYAIISK